MATVTTVDVTGNTGSSTMPVNANDVYNMVETIVNQNIRGAKSTNQLDDAFYFYDAIDKTGAVIEEAIIEMANQQSVAPTPTFAANDPVVNVKYFNNWEHKVYPTTVRRSDIRKIIAGNSNVGVDGVAAEIIDTLTQGEGHQAFINGRAMLLGANVTNYATILGGVPLTMDGVLIAIRDMYDAIRADNDYLTGTAYVSAVPDADIRIAIPRPLLNLIDVTKLANVFNLDKVAMMGKIVPIDTNDLDSDDALYTERYKIVAYDRKAFGHGRRLYEYTQDIIGETLYTNHFLHVEDCWFYNDLFKACSLDCASIAGATFAANIGNPTEYTITKTLTHCSGSNPATKIASGLSYTNTITAASGYTLTGATVSVTMGGSDITATAYADGKVTIPNVTGNVAVTVTAVSA